VLVDGIFYFVILVLMAVALAAALHLWDPQDAGDDRSGAAAGWRELWRHRTAAAAGRIIHPRAHHRH
jgi:hypothetical protein